jgi:uncharacterized protein (TIGR00106 family)
MKMSAMISIIPIGTGVSLSGYVAACERVLRDAGLDPQLHAHGSNVEGEWDTVMDAVRRCHEVVHEMGAPRISTYLKLGTRTDRDPDMAAMVRSVEDKLKEG